MDSPAVSGGGEAAMLGCACAVCGVCGAGHVKLMGRESTSTDPRDSSNYGDPPDRRPITVVSPCP